MIKAIYIAREDGDYDFVAAFAEEYDSKVHVLTSTPPAASDAYAKKMAAEGEEVIVKDFSDLSHLTDVIEGWEANFEKKLGAIK